MSVNLRILIILIGLSFSSDEVLLVIDPVANPLHYSSLAYLEPVRDVLENRRFGLLLLVRQPHLVRSSLLVDLQKSIDVLESKQSYSSRVNQKH